MSKAAMFGIASLDYYFVDNHLTRWQLDTAVAEEKEAFIAVKQHIDSATTMHPFHPLMKKCCSILSKLTDSAQ
jgi:hypothetical protein